MAYGYGLDYDKGWLLDDEKRKKFIPSLSGEATGGAWDPERYSIPHKSLSVPSFGEGSSDMSSLGNLAGAMGDLSKTLGGGEGDNTNALAEAHKAAVGARTFTPVEPIEHPWERWSSNNWIPTRQMGGPVQAGKPYVVGEEGQEVMIPDESGVIMPNPDTVARINDMINQALTPPTQQKILGIPTDTLHKIARGLGSIAYAMDPRSPGGRVGITAAGMATEALNEPLRRQKAMVEHLNLINSLQKMKTEMQRPQMVESLMNREVPVGTTEITAPGAEGITTEESPLGIPPLQAKPYSMERTEYKKFGDTLGPNAPLIEYYLKNNMSPPANLYTDTPSNLEGILAKKVNRGELSLDEAYSMKNKATEKKAGTASLITDQGWSISSEDGIWVAKKMNPDGTITTEPFDRDRHGSAVQPAAFGVGMVPNADPTLTGEASLANYTPQVQALAKKLVRAEIPYPSAFALKDPLWKTIIQAAADYDPSFNAQTYQVRLATKKSFTSGKDANNINSINTLVGHLGSLNKSAEALDNTSFRLYNRLANLLITETGDNRVKKFNMDLGAVESELATVFKQTGATDQEIKAWRERIDASDSPEQLKTNIHEAVELMNSRLEALRNKYFSAMGLTDTHLQILSPKSIKILKQMGIDTNLLDTEQEGATTQEKTTEKQMLPPEAKSKLVEGQVTTFANGQKWTLKNGVEQRVQ